MDLSGFDMSNAKSAILGNLTKNLADKHMASVTTPNLVNQLMSEYGNDEIAVQAIMKLSLDPSMANADLDTWKSKIEDTKVQIQLDTSAKNLDNLSKELTRLQTDASNQQTRLNNKSAYNMKATDVYIYVGGQPEATTSTGETPGGFNGGGKGCSRTYNYSSYGQGGGGATDVRIGKNDLYARVIVAGGGGGSSSENSLTTKYGGGTTGGSSASGYGATQTAAGTNGSFGQGGSATTSGTNYNYGSGGGGGGWYGGGACSNYSDSTNYQGYNGGGSGYVYTSATAANYPSGNYVNSSYYLTNAQTIAGNQSFKSPNGTNETGHTGNGFCRITRKSGKIFVKQNGSWIKV